MVRRLDGVAAGAAEVAVVEERDCRRGAAVRDACREAAVGGRSKSSAAAARAQRSLS